MKKDKLVMEKVIKQAQKARGLVSPNPLVGCIIMKNNDVLGIGYHEFYGGPHAEVNAIELAKRKGYKLKGATLYTNLEPCSHEGKTPPCVDLIIKEKIKRVVIGMQDPYEEVNGKGIEKLENAGIEVVVGVLEEECRELNKFFIEFVTNKKPYLTIKIGQTIDGKIALGSKKSRWITGEKSRKRVHRMRSIYDAVLIGTNTAKLDDPSLTVREVKGRDPLRLIIDKDLSLPDNLKIFRDANKEKTYIITSKANKNSAKKPEINYLYIEEKDGRLLLSSMMKEFYKNKIASVLIEGGAEVYSEFVNENLFNDIFLFIAPKIMGKGISGFEGLETSSLDTIKTAKFEYAKKIGDDMLIYCSNK